MPLSPTVVPRRRILAEEGLARLPGVHPVTVTTPCGPYAGLRAPSPDSLVVVSIVRAGEVTDGVVSADKNPRGCDSTL